MLAEFAIGIEDIERLHRRITAAGHLHRANRVAAVLSKMFSLAMRWRMRDDNPCKGIERNREHHRRRYLSSDEMVRLIEALNAHPDRQAANIVRLLLMTGARRGEVLAMDGATSISPPASGRSCRRPPNRRSTIRSHCRRQHGSC